MTGLGAEYTRLYDKIAKLEQVLSDLFPFLEHYNHCEVDRTDFCTCGMKKAANAALAALRGL